MQPTLVVMAAGIGSRYGGLKQIDPVGPAGEIVIDYSIYDAIRAGFERVVFVIRRDIEAPFRAIADAHFAGRIAVDYVFQELNDLPAGFATPPDRKKPWGTGQAILAARAAVRGPFGVINADDFYGRRSFEILAAFLRGADPAATDYALVGFTLRNTLSEHGAVARGVCAVDGAGRLTAIAERLKIEKDGAGARYEEGGVWHPLTGDEPVSMNMWGFTPRLFESLDSGFRAFLPGAMSNPKSEFLVPTHIGDEVRAGRARVRVLATPEQWFGVTYPEDKPAVAAGIRALIAQGAYPASLWSGSGGPAAQR